MIKLLFVDDEQGILDTLSQFFEARDFTTFSARSGEEAVELVKSEMPDIVFLDIKMPGLGGMEVLKEIKNLKNSIRVFLLSAVDDKTLVEKSSKLGADGYITKPFMISYLEEVVVKKIQEILLAQNKEPKNE